MPSLRVATWNIAGARREGTSTTDLEAVVAGARALDADLLVVQEVDRLQPRSGRADQPAAIADAFGPGWSWSYAAALVGEDFRPLVGPDPGGPAYGNLLLSRLPLEAVEHLRFPPAGGGEQRTALVGVVRVGSRPVTIGAGHLSNKQGHNVRQLRELQELLAARPGPRLLLGDLNLTPLALRVASRPGWPGSGRGNTFPTSRPNRQLAHVLRSDPAGVLAVRASRVVAAPVSDHRALVVDLDAAG